MRYLSNHLSDFDETCSVMHIRRTNPIVDKDLKINQIENQRLWTAAILKI